MLKTGKYSRVRTLPVPTDSEKKVFVSNGWQRNLGLLFRGLPGPGVGREHSGVVLLREGRQVAAQQQQTGQQQQHRLLKTIILFGDDDVLFFFISTRSSEERVKRGLNINRETGEENSLERTVNIKTRML